MSASVTDSASDRFFEPLLRDLAERSASSLVGIYGPRTTALRSYLLEALGRSAGQEGSFLADPVFEAIFDWERVSYTMRDLAETGCIGREVVTAMDTASGDERLVEYRFPAERRPFTHQYIAWKLLGREPPQSVLITSGTGSGKTEGFLVPIIDDLAREQAQGRGRLKGVRALFLYPLNALINSQRDRLSAWLRPFGGNLRYCLYKGDTPDEMSIADKRRAGGEELVPDRYTLRKDPPPILVTNATMLEYMLIRPVDAPIVDKSRGKLRWIVLDEVHTYLGSRSAELALLLRRVLHAFGVQPSQVRFVATSATIGDDSERSEQQLGRFLADIAGIPQSAVHVVRGRRDSSSLIGLPSSAVATPGRAHPSLEYLRSQTPIARGRLLTISVPARRIRRALLEEGALTLTQLTRRRLRLASDSREPTPQQRQETLELLDLATDAIMDDDNPFLRVRGHLFHRTQGGIWACISKNCPGRKGTALDDIEWAYGKLFFERRERCDACCSLVLAMVLCGECGKEYVVGNLKVDQEGQLIAPRPVGATMEEGHDELDHLEDEDAEVDEVEPDPHEAVVVRRYLVCPGTPGVTPIHLNRETGRLTKESVEGSQAFGDVPLWSICCECGTRRAADQLLRPFRAGASLVLRSVIPVLLDHTPPLSSGGIRLPSDGRRLLTFTDSRQGTARFALNAQIEAERNYTRSFMYHSVAAARSIREVAREEVERLAEEVSELERLACNNPKLAAILHKQRQELDRARAPQLGQLRWAEAIDKMAQQPELADWMREQWRHIPLSKLKTSELAEIALLREFARRPKRQNSLETLGFIAVDYEGLARMVPRPPEPWERRGLDASEWRNFLKIAIDFGVRGRRAIEVAPDLVPWLGVPHRPIVLVGPDGERLRGVGRWSVSSPRTRRSRLVCLLRRVLDVDHGPAGDAEINECLRAAWGAVRAWLSNSPHGRALSFREQVVLKEVSEAWLCPITQRVVDTVVAGYTPYITPDFADIDVQAKKIHMPKVTTPFWRKANDQAFSRTEIEEVIRADENIRVLRKRGVWQGLSDRIFGRGSYYQVAEHSAQLGAGRLQELEERFRKGTLNVLSCSTTMEMGVDIGGLSAVAMNNAPPSPANYLQRVGRAGRRSEGRAFALTLCNTSPHGEFVFRNPRWPFDGESHVTQVSLGSERIVQRHVNALALTRFCAGLEVDRLTAGWFFEARGRRGSVSHRFRHWLCSTAVADPWLVEGFKHLLHRSVLEGEKVESLLRMVAGQIREATERWSREVDPLREELSAPRVKQEAVGRALGIQLRRLREEYLLKELALRNFLPGYGFPTQVVPFVTTTVEDLGPKGRSRGRERDDNIRRTRQYPTRDLSQALQEYSPGSDVVVDGRVLQSSGLTLNWKVPASHDAADEIQALRVAWRCSHCGTIDMAARAPEQCESEYCADKESKLKSQQYIEPAGFAVDIRHRATNDLSRFGYVPVRQPWIATAGEQWQSLARPELGRFRYSPRGHVFAYTAGEHGNGFAVCLRCGRAASESKSDESHDLPEKLQNHKPMRGGKAAGPDGRCRGNDDTFAIRRYQWLGVSRETDVFELQLRTVSGRSSPSLAAACSIAVALREALAARIGIDDREIGWAVNKVRIAETGEETRSIVLYDAATGGAGFVAQAGQHLSNLLRRARKLLDCPRECDKACHACLLSYDTHHDADHLDRYAALRVLTDSFLDGLLLPSDAQVFGPQTQLEFDPVAAAIARELRATDTVRLHLGGGFDQWSLEDWPLRTDVQRWTAEQLEVEVVLPNNVGRIPLEASAWLTSWARSIGVKLLRGRPTTGTWHLVAELHGSERQLAFAVPSVDALVPGRNWGVSGESAHIVRGYPESTPTVLSPIRAHELRGTPAGKLTAVELSNAIRGPVNAAGDAFWHKVVAVAPELAGRIRNRSPILEVLYQDRYVRSPLNARLVAEMFAALVRLANSGADSTRFRIVTTRPTTKRRVPRYVSHDWPTGRNAKSVIEALFAAQSMEVAVAMRDIRHVPHPRELGIKWRDGARWRCRLEQGFGFVQAAGPVQHDFEKSAGRQGRMLATANFDVQPRETGYAYVYEIE